MHNQKRIFLALILIVLCLSVYFGAFRVQADSVVDLVTPDRQEIKRVINVYFEARYQSIKNLQIGNFDALIIHNTDNLKELDKLDLTIYQNEVYQLRYQTYVYYLDFSEIIFDSSGSTANVNVTEGSDVIYENSSPKPTKLRGIQQALSLQKLNGNWKISSDKYEDEFWRMIKNINLTNAELRTKIEKTATLYASIKAKIAPVKSLATQNLESCTILCYNRAGAVGYANDHYDYDNRNQNYAYFLNNDCTNFVSQALFLGGGISQYIPFSWDPSSDGWYYKVDNGTHSTSWDEVDPFHAFLVPAATERHYNYLGGPQARELDPNNPIGLQTGVIIQFNDSCSTSPTCSGWDHSVIVEEILGNGTIYVDSHSPDGKHISLYFFLLYAKQTRYIHINDNLYRPFVYIPAIKGGQMIPQLAGSTAYPAPGQNASSAMSAYPPPGSNNTAKRNQAYPAA